MPTIKLFGYCAIQIYSNEHGRPHFHLVTPNERASVAIDNQDVLAGSINRNRCKEALEWAGEHKEELLAKWQEFN